MEKVVAIARMSPGIVRFYFDSKAAMLIASLQFLSTEFEDQLLVPVAKLKSNPVAALELMVDLYLDPEIASPRKVSVWYAFWGEASSRQEYYDICGQKDEGFAVLVRELVGRLIEDTGQSQLDPDGIALGLIGVLEMLWQDFAFRQEEDIDRRAAKRRCMAYLRSVFPGKFASPEPPGGGVMGAQTHHPLAGWTYASERAWSLERDALFRSCWQVAAHESELMRAGDFVALDLGAERVLLMRDAFGDVQALRNSCPHTPHTLVDLGRGRLEDGIVCAAHGLKFASGGRCIAGGSADLVTLQARVAAGFYWVRSSAAAGEQAAAAGPAERGAEPWEEIFRVDGGQLQVLPEIEIRANWKLIAERWLETLEARPDAVFAPASTAIDASGAPIGGGGWSAARYRRLVESAAQEHWRQRFIAPNQLLERRPDGLCVLQIIATGPAECRLRRLYVGRTGEGAKAVQYLAGRLAPWCRRATTAIAESAQRGLSEFGYRTAGGGPSPGVAWLRNYLSSRLPALAGERAPNESPQMHYNRPPA